jgi:hypothetical protein
MAQLLAYLGRPENLFFIVITTIFLGLVALKWILVLIVIKIVEHHEKRNS